MIRYAVSFALVLVARLTDIEFWLKRCGVKQTMQRTVTGSVL